MIKEITAMGKDVIEAKENARAALGAGPLDDVQFEILHAGSKGIFGIIGVKPAQVRAYMELPDPEERHRRKSERPHRETEHKETEKKEGSNNKKKRHNDKKKNHNKTEKVKTAAPAESDLKLEERIVSTGEDMSYDFVTTLIANIGLSAEAKLYSCEDGTRRIIIKGDDASTLIGHHGDTLDALQYLANLACARKNINGERDKSRVTVDIEGYRAKREETLRALARRMAQKALRNKRSVMLEPMSAYERRIIHSEIQGIEGVSTNSIGSDNNRKIVIFLTDKKPTELFEEDENNIASVEEVSIEETVETVEDTAEQADNSETLESEE